MFIYNTTIHIFAGQRTKRAKPKKFARVGRIVKLNRFTAIIYIRPEKHHSGAYDTKTQDNELFCQQAPAHGGKLFKTFLALFSSISNWNYCMGSWQILIPQMTA